MQALVHDPDRPVFPFDLHWDAQQLTDAVPLRLFEVIDFQALHYGQYDASVNDPRASSRRPTRPYAAAAELPIFRVR